MASIVFTAIHSIAFTGKTAGIINVLGASAAAAAGTFIDQRFLFPALGLTPEPQDIQGQRIDDFQLSFASDGSPKNYGMGPVNKAPATILWVSPVRETKITKRGGGKNAAAQIQYEYKVDIALGYNTGKTINNITELWANGQLIMTQTNQPNITDSASQLSVTAFTRRQFVGWRFVNGRWQLTWNTITWMYIRSPNGGPDLSQFRTGVDTTVSGFSNAGNNGTFNTLYSYKFTGVYSTGQSVLVLLNSNAVTEAAAAQTPTISQSVPTWDKSKFKSFTNYKGDQVAVDPTIEADVGVGNAKIWANESYLVIEDLNIIHFGNQIPVSWMVGYKAEATTDVGTAVGEVLARGGLAAGRYDTSFISDNLRGYYYSGPRSTLEALNPLVIAFDLLAQERNGKIVFFKRGNAPEVNVIAGDLTAHEFGSAPPPKPAVTRRMNPKDLPAEVRVEFIDADSVDSNGDPAYEKGMVRAPRNVVAHNTEVVRTVLDRVVMTRAEALKVAKRVQWTIAANMRRIAVQLPPSYILAQENDILKVPVGDGTKRLLVGKLSRGNNYLLIGDGVVEEAQTLSW